MANKKLRQRVKLALAAVGPGLFLIGYNIGTGSVTTMAKSGAEHGMSLFWTLLLSSVFTFVLMVAYGQVTLVTGKTILFNHSHHWHLRCGPVHGLSHRAHCSLDSVAP